MLYDVTSETNSILSYFFFKFSVFLFVLGKLAPYEAIVRKSVCLKSEIEFEFIEWEKNITNAQ